MTARALNAARRPSQHWRNSLRSSGNCGSTSNRYSRAWTVQLRMRPSATFAPMTPAYAAMRAIGLDRPIRPAGHSVSVEMTSSIHFVQTAIAGTSTAETGRSTFRRACVIAPLWGTWPDGDRSLPGVMRGRREPISGGLRCVRTRARRTGSARANRGRGERLRWPLDFAFDRARHLPGGSCGLLGVVGPLPSLALITADPNAKPSAGCDCGQAST